MVETMNKTLASFRLKSAYLKTFKKACELSEVSMTSVLESLIFQYLKDFDHIMKEEEDVDKLVDRISDYVKKNNQKGDIELKGMGVVQE